jgi:tetratricopeptide (TPR) repeat protein
MAGLKKLTADDVPKAMRKAERYRLLGEPLEAESICVDVLEVAPDHHDAQLTLILALSDQFRSDLSRAGEATRRAIGLRDEYERRYYSGIVQERIGKAQMARGVESSDDYANRALRKAMAWYEKAQAIRPPGDDDAIVRWRTCARTIARLGYVAPPDMPATAPFMTE